MHIFKIPREKKGPERDLTINMVGIIFFLSLSPPTLAFLPASDSDLLAPGQIMKYHEIFTLDIYLSASHCTMAKLLHEWKSNNFFLKKLACKVGEKQKTCFSQLKWMPNFFWWNLWYLLLEPLWKTPPNRQKLYSKYEKYGFCSFS